MRLHTLRLQNFRQHADTQIRFERGLTGIIGPNGSGKSTVLEAIAWALYGNPAARGTRDSIRFSRAAPRAAVKVELEFELAGHRYRVVRGLSSAECFLDGGTTPIASTLTGVTELLQRRLGMTRAEFFHTYFTGQKELDVMAALGPAERARFLSRVLGYDRLSAAQELARARRRTLVAEITGLKHGMPDPAAIAQAAADAEARLTTARTQRQEATTQQAATTARLATLTPQWQDLQSQREQRRLLEAELRVAESELLGYGREIERITGELEALGQSQRELAAQRQEAQVLVPQRGVLASLDALAAAEARRQALLERLRSCVEEEAKLAERAQRLESAPGLEQETQHHLAALRQTLLEQEQALDAERTAWARDRQEAETRLETLRTQYTELVQQRETLDGLGADSPCPTCGQPLGAKFEAVREQLVEQLETVRLDGNYYRQRVEQLATVPAAVVTLEEARKPLQQEVANAERRLARIQAALTEASTIAGQRTEVAERRLQVTQQLTVVPDGYDAARHAAVRADVQQLQALEMRIARLEAQVEREQGLLVAREQARVGVEQAGLRMEGLQAQRALLGADDTRFETLRAAYESASAEARSAELHAVAAAGEATRAEEALDAAAQAQRELARLAGTLATLEQDRSQHDELDKALSELRTDLNFQLRPELAETASRFLDDLTDGRYTALEFDEEYRVLVMEDGLPKPVISGGEEDLCNLVLRLAISQMIAERAGQAFSLLILDEVFGSLDEARRANVVELLRRLHDRFEQVIVITHIEQVREGLDRLLVVRYDESRGCSEVTAG